MKAGQRFDLLSAEVLSVEERLLTVAPLSSVLAYAADKAATSPLSEGGRLIAAEIPTEVAIPKSRERIRVKRRKK